MIGNINKISEELAALINSTKSEWKRLKKSQPTWNPKDIRLTALSRMLYVLHSTLLEYTFAPKVPNILHGNEWWEKNGIQRIVDSRQIENIIEGFKQYIEIGFFNIFFSTTESAFRIFLRAIDSAACNKGTDSFKSIYYCLLQSKLSKCPDNSVELLDLLRSLRNTLHNNGVYFHRDMKDLKINYKGETYEFHYGKPISFMSCTLLFELLTDMRDLLLSVIQDDAIRNIDRELTDPFEK